MKIIMMIVIEKYISIITQSLSMDNTDSLDKSKRIWLVTAWQDDIGKALSANEPLIRLL